jgi:hypothetical protein
VNKLCREPFQPLPVPIAAETSERKFPRTQVVHVDVASSYVNDSMLRERQVFFSSFFHGREKIYLFNLNQNCTTWNRGNFELHLPQAQDGILNPFFSYRQQRSGIGGLPKGLALACRE